MQGRVSLYLAHIQKGESPSLNWKGGVLLREGEYPIYDVKESSYEKGSTLPEIERGVLCEKANTFIFWNSLL